MDNGPFPFDTIKEAWDYFNKAARSHFAKLLKQQMEDNPKLRLSIKTLTNKDYCARLLYILNMYAFEGVVESEFSLEWAMLLAKPMSAAQGRQSLFDLIKLGLMGELELEDIDDDTPILLLPDTTDVPEKDSKSTPLQDGGDTSSETKFNFD